MCDLRFLSCFVLKVDLDIFFIEAKVSLCLPQLNMDKSLFTIFACLICMSNSVSNGATNKIILDIEIYRKPSECNGD